MSERIEADAMVGASFTLRRYTPADEAAAIELWLRTWQIAYPRIDFDDRVDWWRQRWRDELVPAAAITARCREPGAGRHAGAGVTPGIATAPAARRAPRQR